VPDPGAQDQIGHPAPAEGLLEPRKARPATEATTAAGASPEWTLRGRGGDAAAGPEPVARAPQLSSCGPVVLWC